MPTVSVPQQSGEIILTSSGDAPRVYPIKGGKTTVADGDVAEFLANVAGSTRVADKPADAKP
jgi:hypothetical protein